MYAIRSYAYIIRSYTTLTMQYHTPALRRSCLRFPWTVKESPTNGECRITSYNVCYTKLLRDNENGGDGAGSWTNAFRGCTSCSRGSRSGSSSWPALFRGESSRWSPSVITSYSIHYTKLYETVALPNPTRAYLFSPAEEVPTPAAVKPIEQQVKQKQIK